MVKAQKKYKFTPDYAVPPGYTVKEVMESLNMTQKELAVRTELTVQTLNRIFNGEQPLSYGTANRLELVTGVPANFWNNLEAQYREQLSKIEERKRLESELDWLKTIPTKELIDRGFVPDSKDKVVLLRETFKFFGVNSVHAWGEIWEVPEVAARRSQCFDTCPGSASTWIRMGELLAHQIECQSYDKKKFKSVVIKIRELTVKDPDEFVEEMTHLCAEAGVALVLVPEMKKVPWSGATKWVSANKAMVLLNLRGKSEDLFWFSFFHEAGHVLHDSKKDLLINDGSKDDPREQAADDFAAEILIPEKNNGQIRKLKSKANIEEFANVFNISEGIVVGRYQHLTKKWQNFNGLKRRFEWG